MGEFPRLAARLAVAFCAAGLMSFASLASDTADESAPAELEVHRIGVFGDSLADGLWVGLQRGLRRDPRAGEIIQLSEVSTGLTNYVYRDISEKTRDQLALDDYDTAVVMFGSNDIQGIRTDRGVFRFRSASWEAVYRERIRDIITQLQADGSEVIWVGLPVMRSEGYDDNTVYLNGIFREEVEALGGTFVSTRAASADETGAYAPYLPDSQGNPRLVRADDGIHFTLGGYTRIAAPVVDAIQYAWDNPAPPEPALAEAGTGGRQIPADWLDLSLNGQAYICQPVDVDDTPLVARAAD